MILCSWPLISSSTFSLAVVVCTILIDWWHSPHSLFGCLFFSSYSCFFFLLHICQASWSFLELAHGMGYRLVRNFLFLHASKCISGGGSVVVPMWSDCYWEFFIGSSIHGIWSGLCGVDGQSTTLEWLFSSQGNALGAWNQLLDLNDTLAWVKNFWTLLHESLW